MQTCNLDQCPISVVVPIYKVPYALLNKCVQSILAQTMRDFEVLLIDDGSPDECGAICDAYAARDGRVRALHQENGGLSVVRNNGVRAARGEWICFVDGDDWIEPDALAFAMELRRRAPEDADLLAWDGYADCDGVRTQLHFFAAGPDELLTFSGPGKEALVDAVLPRYHTATYRFTEFGVTWARMYRRRFLLEKGLENVPGLKRMQDLIFNLWVFERARKVCYMDRPLYHYVMHADMVTQKFDPNIARNLHELAMHLHDYVDRAHDGEEYHQRMYVKLMAKINQCFALNYANPNNWQPMRARADAIRRDLQLPNFAETIERLDPRGQHVYLRVLRALLKRRLYRLAILQARGFIWAKAAWMRRRGSRRAAG